MQLSFPAAKSELNHPKANFGAKRKLMRISSVC